MSDNMEFDGTITLLLDGDEELECAIIATFPANDKDYIALMPVDQLENEEGELFFYRYTINEEGEPVLENIEEDEEFEIVADAFDEMLDEEEFNAMDSEDEEQLLLFMCGRQRMVER